MAVTQDDSNGGVKEREETPRIVAYSHSEWKDDESDRKWISGMSDQDGWLSSHETQTQTYRMVLPSGESSSITEEDYEVLKDVDGVEVSKNSFTETKYDKRGYLVNNHILREVFLNGESEITVGDFRISAYKVKVDRSEDPDSESWAEVGSVRKNVGGRQLVKPYDDQEHHDLFVEDTTEFCSIRISFRNLELTDEEYEQFGSKVIPHLVRAARRQVSIRDCRLLKCFERTETKTVCPRI